MPTNETTESTMNATRSLSFYVTVWLAVAIVIGMAAYAVYQYFTMPGMTVQQLLLHHLWHVLALGAVIYMLCWLVFYRVLLRPLQQIYLHLYAVGAGKLEPLVLESNVAEIRTIVEGINLMLRRMEQGVDVQALEHAQGVIAELKEAIRRWEVSEPAATGFPLEKLAALEGSLLAIVRNVNAPAKAGLENSRCPQCVEA